MVNLYIATIKNLPDPKEASYLLEQIPAIRREKTMKYRKKEGRIQSLGAGLLLKQVMTRYGIGEEDLFVEEAGKPGAKGISFNLSHSEEYVICAVSNQPVGCDIQKIKLIYEGMEKRFFAEEEQNYLQSLSLEERREAIIRIWTMKESYVKMTGEGLRMPMNQFIFHIEQEPVIVYRDGKKQCCFIKEYDMPFYKVTVCAMEKCFAKTMEFVKII